MDWVILAAGEGMRLRPLTYNKPKCMIKLNGKSIIHHNIDIILSMDKNARIIIVSGYKSDVLYKHCRGYPGKKIYKQQAIRNGTSNAIYIAKDIVDDRFMVVSGDTWINKDDMKLLMKHPNSLLYFEREDKLNQFGTIEMKKNKILRINEKETNPISNKVNTGLYHFTRDIFKAIERTEIDKRFNEKIITNSINRYIKDGGVFYGYPAKDMLEVTDPKDVDEVERILDGR
jgi:UDP-N-acetylglucosamine diphosphorylase / glucose-1-phosphate thymidylyltransferase / UDP-N-acetylgalactosamine diphosphorylase / glucosamine-1-phosphate N-acetyltransferase / galactosamine-1-phosphate N-acetyltransferase